MSTHTHAAAFCLVSNRSLGTNLLTGIIPLKLRQLISIFFKTVNLSHNEIIVNGKSRVDKFSGSPWEGLQEVVQGFAGFQEKLNCPSFQQQNNHLQQRNR